VTAWLAVLAVGLGSYAMRWVPLAAAGRWTPPARVEHGLRHASLAAIVALAARALRAEDLTGTPADAAATAAAIATGLWATRAGRPLAVVVAAGLLARWLVLALA
jgi:branched-subunit amino acid transport protein